MTKKTTKNLSALEDERQLLIREIDGNILAPEEDERLLESYDETQLQAIDFAIDLNNRMEKRKRRKVWDKTLLWLVVAGFAASYITIILIGMGVLRFQNDNFAVPSVVAAGIIQTYGLARIAAEYFFSDDKKPKS